MLEQDLGFIMETVCTVLSSSNKPTKIVGNVLGMEQGHCYDGVEIPGLPMVWTLCSSHPPIFKGLLTL